MRPNCPLNRPYRPFSGGRPSFKSNEEDPSSRKTSADWAAFLSLSPASLLTGGGQLPTGPHCPRPAAHLSAGAAADLPVSPLPGSTQPKRLIPSHDATKRRSLTALHVTFSPKRELLRSPLCSLRNRAPHTHTHAATSLLARGGRPESLPPPALTPDPAWQTSSTVQHDRPRAGADGRGEGAALGPHSRASGSTGMSPTSSQPVPP